MVVLGGYTRLTRSGLSMVEWRPLMGIIPPIGEAQWLAVFHKYQQFPEYQQINKGMTLDAFKGIFLVEYAHRVLGRGIGLLFALPFLYFLITRKTRGVLTLKLFAMLVLGGLQGLLGWYMVKSGLVNDPKVSQYRLTAHLILAVLIYAYILYVAFGLMLPQTTEKLAASLNRLRKQGIALVVLILVMIMSGGFVAGTHAGFVYNTFPLMKGSFIPEGLFAHQPLWRNFFENELTVQFDHRMIAYSLCVLIPFYCWRILQTSNDKTVRLAAAMFIGMLVIQVSLGISTLVLHVPVPVAVSHQGGALLLLTAAIWMVCKLGSSAENSA